MCLSFRSLIGKSFKKASCKHDLAVAEIEMQTMYLCIWSLVVFRQPLNKCFDYLWSYNWEIFLHYPVFPELCRNRGKKNPKPNKQNKTTHQWVSLSQNIDPSVIPRIWHWVCFIAYGFSAFLKCLQQKVNVIANRLQSQCWVAISNLFWYQSQNAISFQTSSVNNDLAYNCVLEFSVSIK